MVIRLGAVAVISVLCEGLDAPGCLSAFGTQVAFIRGEQHLLGFRFGENRHFCPGAFAVEIRHGRDIFNQLPRGFRGLDLADILIPCFAVPVVIPDPFTAAVVACFCGAAQGIGLPAPCSLIGVTLVEIAEGVHRPGGFFPFVPYQVIPVLRQPGIVPELFLVKVIALYKGIFTAGPFRQVHLAQEVILRVQQGIVGVVLQFLIPVPVLVRLVEGMPCAVVAVQRPVRQVVSFLNGRECQGLAAVFRFVGFPKVIAQGIPVVRKGHPGLFPSFVICMPVRIGVGILILIIIQCGVFIPVIAVFQRLDFPVAGYFHEDQDKEKHPDEQEQRFC